jgi:hypothetical protein
MLFGACHGIWYPEDSILRLLLQCHLVVGFVISIVFTFQHPNLVRVFKLKVVAVMSVRFSFVRVSVIC